MRTASIQYGDAMEKVCCPWCGTMHDAKEPTPWPAKTFFGRVMQVCSDCDMMGLDLAPACNNACSAIVSGRRPSAQSLRVCRRSRLAKNKIELYLSRYMPHYTVDWERHKLIPLNPPTAAR